MRLNTQEKFTAALKKLCEERDLELIVEDTYAHSGFYSLQHPESFEAVLRFPFDFRTGFSSFAEGIGDPGPLGVRAGSFPYSCVRGGGHDEVLARVAAILDEPSETRPADAQLAGAAR
ncbi:MAG TPA: hypothetical protein VG448_06490 [Solirubrobacterales bacterium]|nr:hypothetical protein [Solirubrobacterales bacterium]